MCVVFSLSVAIAADKVELRMLTYFTNTEESAPYYMEAVEQFEKDYPNVKVYVEGLESSSCREKTAIEMASGSPPDIVQIAPSFAHEYSKQGLLLNLWPFIEADEEWVNNYTKGVKSFVTNGELYFAPLGINYGGLYYNKRVFNKVGIKEPPKTWKELIEQVKKIRTAGIHPFLAGGKEYRYAWFISQLMVRTAGMEKMREMAIGSEVTGWTKPENGFIQALSLFKELVDAGGFPKNVNGLSREVAYMMFVNDQGAMWYEGSWLIGAFERLAGKDFVEENIGWAPFPSVEGAEGDQEGGVGGPLGLAISSKLTDQQEKMALELVKRMTSSQTQTKILVGTSHPTMAKTDREAWNKVSSLLKQEQNYYGSIDIIAFPSDVWFTPSVDSVIKEIAVPAIVDGTMTVEEAAEAVNKVAEKYFKK